MSDFLAALHARQRGESPAPAPVAPPAPVAFSWNQRGAPEQSEDLERILALPRRQLLPDDPEALIEEYTQKFRRPGGTMRLLINQALLLREVERVRGCLANIPVGGGKTLAAFLAFTALGVKRGVYLCPPRLREKTYTEHAHFAQHFRIPNLRGGVVYPDTDCIVHVVGYSELHSRKRTDVLGDLDPEVIVADEAHRLKDLDATQSKRFSRFVRAKHVPLVLMSGTLITEYLDHYAHLMRYVLGRAAPVPLDWREVQSWAAALDPRPDGFVADPGALAVFATGGLSVGEGYGRRLAETPGVIIVEDHDPELASCSLNLIERQVTPPPAVLKALEELRRTWTRPDGEELVTALDYSRVAREVAAGLYNRWTWPRGEAQEIRDEWFDARREYFREVRERLKLNRPGEDMPSLCDDAANRYWRLRRKYDEKKRTYAFSRILARLSRRKPYWASEHWERWVAIKDQARPESEGVWIDTFLAEDMAKFGRENPGAVLWYTHDLLGRKVAELGGFPLFGGGDEADAIEREDGSRTIVASRHAHAEGRNLQKFSTCILDSPSSNATVMQQWLGRHHRRGQKADEVNVYLYRYAPELIEAFESAVEKARYRKEKSGKQRLLDATYLFNTQYNPTGAV